MRKLVLRIVTLAATCLFVTCLAYGQIEPMKPYMSQPGFGIVGIGSGQSGKLNVYVDMIDYNLLPPGPCKPDDTGLPPGPCRPGPWRINLTIANGDGSVVVQSVQTADLHQVVTLDYRPTDVPFAPLRKRIRPIVTIDPDENGLIPCVKQTFELIDNNTQRTVVTYQGADNLMEGKYMPESRTSFGFVGLGPGQIAQLNAVNTQDFFPMNGLPPGPCKVTLNFFDVNGRLVSSMTTILQPGRAASLNFNIGSSGGGGGAGRIAVRAEAIVETDDRALIPAIMPTLEIIDASSGKTTGLLIGLL